MSKALKWILGIVIGLVIVAIIAGVAYFAFMRWNDGGWMMAGRYERGERLLPGRNLPWRAMPMFGWGLHNRMMGGFFPFGSILGWILQLGILGLIAYGVYALIRSVSRREITTVVSTPVPTPPVSTSQVMAGTHACANCGYTVQEGWKHCPNCGQEQTG